MIQTSGSIFLLLPLFTLLSCSRPGNSDPIDDTGHPPSLNKPRNDYGAINPWNEFVKKMTSSGEMEIQMAKLAINQSQSDQVKELAEMIRNDHKKVNAELTKLMPPEQPVVVPEADKNNIRKLESTAPAAFDKRYVDLMVQTHVQAIDLMKRALNGNMDVHPGKSSDTAPSDQLKDSLETGTPSKNPEMEEWIRKTLPVLEKHLQQARQMQSDLQD